MKNLTSLATILATILSVPALAGEYEDMSDPLAVYNAVGFAVTNEGLNLHADNAYDTGNPETMGMHVIEIKGIGGDFFGADGNDSVNSLRYRHFNVNMTNGRGSTADVNWNFNENMGTASYSLIQALPKMGPVNFYPLAGLGAVIWDQQGKDGKGYEMPGTFSLVGVYSKIEVTDKIWLNYNPMYTSQLGGNKILKDADAFGLAHEAAISYQLNPQQNVRLFFNWGETQSGTDFSLEYNYQF